MNQLINEKSPYLLQHAHNPVHWQPWGDDAFAQAKATHKPVLVSIGYAACHWCHVMERESFENEEVAAFMNAHFICIKVDREEHPDVDHLYMDALQAISGSGGWPLNMFTTPDKLPFYGGTYFPPVPAHGRVSWMQLLQRIVELWEKQHGDVQQQAQQMVAHLKNASSIGQVKNELTLDEAFCRKAVAAIMANADTTEGGFGRAPKFPGTMAISFLLEHYRLYGDTAARWQALLSLDKMIQGGIYDQVGGGFARYSVDDRWLAPHFEKMLYDNALLICSLSDAYLLTKNPRYKTVIEDTITFLNRELRDESGLYYSAIDADSEGVEGKFYTWTVDDWYELFNHDYDHIATFYGITGDGNWEHTNILHTRLFAEEFAERHNMDPQTLKNEIRFVNETLFNARAKRQRPITDDKALLSWNALINLALTRAGVALGNGEYILEARQHAATMLQLFSTSDGLMHTWKQNEARIAANLDDYAYLVQALIQIGTVTADFKLVKKAELLLEETLAKFSAQDDDLLYFSSVEKDLPVRKVEVYDGAVPSANAVHTHNLALLGFIAENGEWLRRAEAIIGKMKNHILHSSYSFSYWSILAQRSVAGWKMVVCTGEEGAENAMKLRQSYFPQTMAFTFQKEISEYAGLGNKYLSGDSFIFVCNETACLPPVRTINEAVFLLENKNN